VGGGGDLLCSECRGVFEGHIPDTAFVEILLQLGTGHLDLLRIWSRRRSRRGVLFSEVYDITRP
jgi:hypothetical protein